MRRPVPILATLCLAGLAGWGASAPLPPPSPPPHTEEVLKLLNSLDARDPAARQNAICELRLMARRADVMGPKRDRRGEVFEPKVPGLVPHLARAAGDEVEANRVIALYALADTLDPAAVTAIRARLKADASEQVRFQAACLLTEFQDASGLGEMKKALARFRKDPAAAGVFDAERLLASFERITGKSFGPIPMSSALHSSTTAAAKSREDTGKLLDAWAGWWEWTPPAK
jgi:hypothetical protein